MPPTQYKSRSKSKAGTRRSTIVARSKRKKPGFRLSAILRRHGVAAVIILAVLWAGTWLSLSGVLGRTEMHARAAFDQRMAHNGFSVRDILVEGRVNADRDVLLGLINIGRGDPMFAFDPARAQQTLEKDSWVESARVERRLPGIIYIAIQERVPFALWQNQGKVRLIDAKGMTISDVPKDVARFRNLPLVVGDGAAQQAAALLDILKVEPLVMERVEAASYVGGRRWDLTLKNNITVRLPEGDLPVALRRLSAAQEKDALLDKDMDCIDLREPSRIVIRTKPGAAVEDYKVSYKADKAI